MKIQREREEKEYQDRRRMIEEEKRAESRRELEREIERQSR